MNRTMVKEKLNKMEAEIKLIRVGLSKSIDFTVDEKNWLSVKAASKKARSKILKEQYA